MCTLVDYLTVQQSDAAANCSNSKQKNKNKCSYSHSVRVCSRSACCRLLVVICCRKMSSHDFCLSSTARGTKWFTFTVMQNSGKASYMAVAEPDFYTWGGPDFIRGTFVTKGTDCVPLTCL